MSWMDRLSHLVLAIAMMAWIFFSARWLFMLLACKGGVC